MFKRFVQFNKSLSEKLIDIFPSFFWCGDNEKYNDVIINLINKFIKEKKYSKVLEVGGIDRPLLSKSSKIRYDGLDIEYKKECDNIYDTFLNQPIEEQIKEKYDMIISRTLLEHLPNNHQALFNIYKSLNKGGNTIHYLPSKYHPYSLILRLVGNRIQKKVIKILRPWAKEITGYQAFFDKCSPKKMRSLLKQLGFQDIKIICFYRSNDYFAFFLPFFIFITIYENICKIFKLKQLCSGFIIISKK